VSENRGLGGIFGHKKEEVVGFWRRLHNEEFISCTLHHNFIRVIKSKRMRWAGPASHM
jgi:hypothetical protein